MLGNSRYTNMRCLGIPAIQILEAWEFPEYTNVLLEKSQQYWECPEYSNILAGNSHHIQMRCLGIPAIHILEVWEFP
jgi:hypothetical protein